MSLVAYTNLLQSDEQELKEKSTSRFTGKVDLTENWQVVVTFPWGNCGSTLL